MSIKRIGFDPPSGHLLHPNIAPIPAAFRPAWDPYGRWKFALQVPGITNQRDIYNDFIGFGFSDQETREIMAKPEPVVDGLGQPPNYAEGFPTDEQGRWNLEMLPRTHDPSMDVGVYRKAHKGNPRKDLRRPPKGYTSLVLSQASQNWVLFDPEAENWLWPKGFNRLDMPACFSRWVYFVPGNTHMIGYNEISQSLRIQRVRRPFENVQVIYTELGPKLQRLNKEVDFTMPAMPAKPAFTKERTTKGGKKNIQSKSKAKIFADVDPTGEAGATAHASTAQDNAIITRRISPRDRNPSQKAKEATGNAAVVNEAVPPIRSGKKRNNEEILDTAATAKRQKTSD